MARHAPRPRPRRRHARPRRRGPRRALARRRGAQPLRPRPRWRRSPAPGKTSQIRRVSSVTEDGWRFDFYRNPAYPCSVSGDNTFTIATRLGVPDDEVHPLWVFMHGGGVGYFDPTGKAMPNNGQKVEEDAALQQRNALVRRPQGQGGRRARRLPDDGRVDVRPRHLRRRRHRRPEQPEPRSPSGKLRTVNGLFATKAAIQYALTTRATDDYFLHGGSAGSFGSCHVGWALEAQGIAPAGIIGDSGVHEPGLAARRPGQGLRPHRRGAHHRPAAAPPRGRQRGQPAAPPRGRRAS